MQLTMMVLRMCAAWCCLGAAGADDTLHQDSATLHNNAKTIEQCGVDAAFICSRFFGRLDPIDSIARHIAPSVVKDGMSITELREILTRLSLHTKLVHGEADVVPLQLSRGSLVILPDGIIKHYFVYLAYDKKGDTYYRYNPPYASGWISKQQLLDQWPGYALVVAERPTGGDVRPVRFWGAVGLGVVGLCLVAGAGAMRKRT